MNNIEKLLNSINSIKELENSIKEKKQYLDETISKLTMEDFQSMSFIELFHIYNNIKYYKSFETIQKSVKDILINKRNTLYPEYKKAIYYLELNDLDLDDEVIHSLDAAIAKSRKGDYLSKNASLYRPFAQYFDILLQLGICEEAYVLEYLYEDFDGCNSHRSIISKEDYLNHKRTWELIKLIKNETNENVLDKYIEELNDLEERGYGYIYLAEDDYIEDEDDFNHYLVDTLYKLVKERNTSFDKYLIS